MEFIRGPVKLIGAAAGDERDLSAGTAALIRILPANGDSELLNRIQRHWKRSIETILTEDPRRIEVVARSCRITAAVFDACGLVVVNVYAIKRDVVLVSTRADNFTTWRDARLQAEQLDNIARLQRQLSDLNLIEGISDSRIGGVESSGLGFHANRLRERRDLHLHVECRGRIHEQTDTGLGDDCKAGLFSDKNVTARR